MSVTHQSDTIQVRCADPSRTQTQWQLHACQQLAAELGLTIGRTYSDEGTNRRDMRRLIADVASGEVGTLLLARYDRLPRSHAENARIASALFDNGVQVYAANIGPHRLNDQANFLRQINAATRPSESASEDHAVV